MTLADERLDHFKKQLSGLRADIISKVRRSREDRPSAEDSNKGDMADIARANHDRDVYFSLSESDRMILQAIDHALVRVHNGTFGKCRGSDCEDGEVGEARLEALPYAVLCAYCQEKQDLKRTVRRPPRPPRLIYF